MKLILTALGSYGDVYPMVGLGAAMRRRGHQVQMVANPYFRPVIESAELELLPIGTIEEYDQLAHHPDLWHPIRGPRLVLQTATARYLRTLYQLIDDHYVVGDTVLGAHMLDMASRIFQEKHGAPLASLHFAPLGFRSLNESPRMFNLWMNDAAPGWVKQLQYWAGDRLFVDRMLGREVNGLRAELGFPPIKRILNEWYFSPDCVLGLFPDWYAKPQPEWPTQTQLVGFPLWDQVQEADKCPPGMSKEVLQFLEAGTAPLVFSPGSAMTEGEAFFVAAVEACQRLRRRGMLVTNYSEHLPADLPSDVCAFDFVPFSQLLPRAAAFVHHGGIGSSAQGLAGGCPQLIMPMAYDQLDNAARLERLGVGTTLRRQKFRGPELAGCLEKLLASEQTKTQCQTWSQRCDGQQSLKEACEILERLLTK